MQMTTRPDLAPSARRGRAAAMLLTGFVTQNLAVGTTFGAYGLIVDALSREFHASHSLVALGMGMIALCLGLLAPLAGTLLDRWSVRSVMMLGAVFAAVGFLAASQAQSIGVFLFCFGALGGIGITFIGPLPSAKLAGGWFPQAPGKAIGFVAIPLLIAVGPPLYSRWIGAYGWRSLFTLLGVVFLLLVPLLWFVRSRPPVRRPVLPMAGLPVRLRGAAGASAIAASGRSV
ncbi:MAG: MFS transporter [Gammaproteobacteria bacterium]|nr:MFS transporter [Gammaproteobacteria bacterium]